VLTLSRLGLGTHRLHRLISGNARQRLLQLAFELGIRYFDTAPSYGNGIAEREIGRFAAAHRSELVIATKFGIPFGRVPRIPGSIYAAQAAGLLARRLGIGKMRAARDFSSATARTSLEQSLRNLRTSYVDILYLHDPAASMLQDPEGLLRTLESLRTSGKTRHIGLSGSSNACAEIGRAYPALGEILQIEMPADPQGLPEAAASCSDAAVHLWEFPAGARPSPPLADVMERLYDGAPKGTILLSTRHAAQLRQAAELIRRLEARGDKIRLE
jgi:aryl-alcohol dehydrogenase-like predicted oxidoreductase